VRERWSSLLEGFGFGTLILVASLLVPHVPFGELGLGFLLPKAWAGLGPLWLLAVVSVVGGLWVGLR